MLVSMTWVKHLFPFRTQKLSPMVVTILGSSPGKIARRQHKAHENYERRGLLTHIRLLTNWSSPPQCRRTSGLAKCHWHFSPLIAQGGRMNRIALAAHLPAQKPTNKKQPQRRGFFYFETSRTEQPDLRMF